MSIKSIMRERALNFLNTSYGTETPAWALMNKGIESAAVAYNATTSERHYIADVNGTSETTGFSKQLDVTQYAYENDTTFEYVDDMFYNDAKGADSDSEILQVFLYRAPANATTGIPAKRQTVNIQLDSHGGDGGDQLSIGYNVLFKGDPIYGNVDLVDGVPTFTASEGA